MKHCSDCGEWKELDNFHNRKASKDGKQVYCKTCRSKKTREYFKPDLEGKDYYQRYFEKYNETLQQKQKAKYDSVKNTPEFIYKTYIINARKRNYIFELSFDHFKTLIKQSCYFCLRRPEKIGIDRLNNTIGYTKENSVPCCTQCNMAKGKTSYDKFIYMCALVTKEHGMYLL